MRKRGEITVFLSLTIVCILSLFLGLLESARTTGSRLYAQMAADSAAMSVMSQYNRNLWNMYHLLFLETESEAAIQKSYSEYLEFYTEQENWYPMKLEDVEILETIGMMEDGGVWLENSALSYVKYRLPDIAGDFVGIAEDAANASKAGDFRELFEVCRQTGKKTRKLEACRRKADESLEKMRELVDELQDAAGSESGALFESLAEKTSREMRSFSKLVDRYEEELEKISEHRKELEGSVKYDFDNADTKAMVSQNLNQELLAYEQVEEAAKEQLNSYCEIEKSLENNQSLLDEAISLLEEERYEYVYVETGSEDANAEDKEPEMELVPIGPDWDAIGSVAAQIEVPGEGEKENVDHEKALRLDKLEELFQGDLLSLVLPEGTEISRRSVSLRGIPSKIQKSEFSKSEDANNKMAELDMPWLKELESAVVKQFLVNEYCFLSFDSFREKCSRKAEPNNQPLLYEQEYILCGKPSDRENLADTIEKLLTVRGSMNLLYLLRSPGMCAEADALSIAVSGGIAPVKFIISFFILTMWAFGEAVLDVKQLMNGGHVSFWKSDDQWELSLEELLAFRFLEPVSKVDEEARGEGSDYKDHLRVLFFLLNRELRNFRMMDVIQWNVRTIQKDFAVEDCICGVEVEAEIREQHMFLMKNSYKRTVKAVGTYE